MSTKPELPISLTQLFIATLWPSFMVAIVATGLFFSAFHPRDLYPFDLDFDVSILGAYTIGFFLFWLLGALSSGLTIYFTVTNCQAAMNAGSTQQK